MKPNIKPRNRTNDLLTQNVVGETMIYDLRINKAFLLNPTSSLIWTLCDGTRSVADIANYVGEELDETVPEDLVWIALDQLDEKNLLERSDDEKANFLGLSRREVVRKFGLSSMVALPLITAIVIPNSVEGQSCLPDNGLCAVPADCCSGCCADVSDGAAICTPLTGDQCLVIGV
jgi:hypothetical protein